MGFGGAFTHQRMARWLWWMAVSVVRVGGDGCAQVYVCFGVVISLQFGCSYMTATRLGQCLVGCMEAQEYAGVEGVWVGVSLDGLMGHWGSVWSCAEGGGQGHLQVQVGVTGRVRCVSGLMASRARCMLLCGVAALDELQRCSINEESKVLVAPPNCMW